MMQSRDLFPGDSTSTYALTHVLNDSHDTGELVSDSQDHLQGDNPIRG